MSLSLQYALPLIVSSLFKFSEVDPVLDSFKVEANTAPSSQQWYTTGIAGGRPWNYSEHDSRIELLTLMMEGDDSLGRMRRRLEKWGKRIERMFRNHV